MKIDTHVLFLIVVVGVISAGLVGATVLNSDVSIKQETFDGIKVSVPADSRPLSDEKAAAHVAKFPRPAPADSRL